MKLISENTSRKVDSLGRVSIPKSLRDRLVIKTEDMVDFYLLEDDNGDQYVCFSGKKTNNSKYELAAKVLEELGLDIPLELAEKIWFRFS